MVEAGAETCLLAVDGERLVGCCFVRTAVNSDEGYTRPTSVEMTKHLPV